MLRSSHFYIWMAFGALIYCSDELDRLFGLSYFLIPTVLIPAVIAVTVCLTGILKNFRNRHWRALAAAILAPLVAIGVFATLLKLRIDPDWIHFQFARATYLRQVRESTAAAPKHLQWNWGETGSATGPNIFYTLVFDEADKPLSKLESIVQGPHLDVRPLGDHFYLITEIL